MRVAVVGGGISGLTAAHLIAAGGGDVVLVDDAEAPGGLIASARKDGFLCERGPQAVLDGPEETRALIASAGLTERVRTAAPAARRRWVYVGGALQPFPTSPPALISTGLLSARAKLRLLWEPFVPRGTRDDESVQEFVARRFGPEAAARAAAPALIGVYAGDAGALAMREALPRVFAMEREHGSVLRGLFHGRRRAAPTAGAPPRRGMGRPISFPDGLAELPRALAAGLGPRRVRARATGLAPRSGAWQIALDAAPAIDAERVIVATPAASTAALLAPLAPEAATAIAAVPHAPVAVVGLGFRSIEQLGVDLDGYGFVVARGEGVATLGCQYESSVFAERAPAGGAFLRVLLGGTFDPALVDADDGALVMRALSDLRRVAGLRRDPDFSDVSRARPGIPQYDQGHAARIRAVDAALANLPGLTVIGNTLRGVGVNDCIRAGAAAAETALR